MRWRSRPGETFAEGANHSLACSTAQALLGPPKTVRLEDGSTPKGYMLEQFRDAFSRYLLVSERHTDTTSMDPGTAAIPDPPHVADGKRQEPASVNACGDVAAERLRWPRRRRDRPPRGHRAVDAARRVVTRHDVTAADLFTRPGALLTRSHLRELGLKRRAIDAVFRACPVVAIPGYSRPLIRVEDYSRSSTSTPTRRPCRPREKGGRRRRACHGTTTPSARGVS